MLHREELIYFKHYDDALDLIYGGINFLNIPKIAQSVADKMHKYDGLHYHLICYTIMPNHVHALFDFSAQLDAFGNYSVNDYVQLYQVMNLIKGGTACYANGVLNRRGTHFWQKDSYDHYVRKEDEQDRIINYIRQNPVKAKLVDKWEDWAFTYVR